MLQVLLLDATGCCLDGWEEAALRACWRVGLVRVVCVGSSSSKVERKRNAEKKV